MYDVLSLCVGGVWEYRMAIYDKLLNSVQKVERVSLISQPLNNKNGYSYNPQWGTLRSHNGIEMTDTTAFEDKSCSGESSGRPLVKLIQDLLARDETAHVLSLLFVPAVNRTCQSR